MTKSATINSGARLRKAPTPAMAKSRFSTNLKVIIGAAAAVLAIGGAIIAAMPEPGASKSTTVEPNSAGPTNSTGTLNAFVTKFNFGSISMAAGKVTHRYSIVNTSNDPIAIHKIYTSCMCTTASLVKDGEKSAEYGMAGHGPIPTINVPMKPGENAVIEVVFDPAAHGPAGIGPIDRTITIENSAGRPLVLAFVANVTP